jgi:hypothetical protein
MVGANMKGAQRDALTLGHSPRLNSKKTLPAAKKIEPKLAFLNISHQLEYRKQGPI